MQSETKKNTEQSLIQIIGFLMSMGFLGGLTLAIWLVMLSPIGSSINTALQHTPWHLSRATGFVGYLLLSGSVIWGLILSTKIVKEVTPPPLVMATHKFISWLSLVFVFFHVYLLLFDSFYDYTFFDLFIPFIGPYRPGAVGLGVIGLYIMLLSSMSFAFKKWLGQKNWRRIHFLTFPAYGMITLHGFLAGTDSNGIGMIMIYLASVTTTLFLTNYRLVAGGKAKSQKS